MRFPLSALLVLGSLYAQDPVLKFSRQVPRAEFLYVISDGHGDVFALGRCNDGLFSVPRTAAQPRLGGGYDIIVAKFRGSDGEMVAATFLGGTLDDVPTSIALDPQGFVYVGGATASRNFPATEGAVQRTPPGTATNGFVTKFNNSLTGVVFSTYIGGSAITRVTAVASDRLGNAYVAGTTDARNFPTTPGAIQAVGGAGMAFAMKLNATGTSRIFSTLLGVASPIGIASDLDGNSIVAGNVSAAGFPVTADALQASLNRTGASDLFVTRLNAFGGLQYSTYLGGTANDQVSSMIGDSSGSVYLGGVIYSTAFPGTEETLGEVGTGFVTKFSAGRVVWTRPLRGNALTAVGSLELDAEGGVVVAGTTSGTHFPTTPGAYQRCAPADASVGLVPFYVRLAPDGAVNYSSYVAETVGGPRWAATLPAGDLLTMSRVRTPFEQAPSLIRRYAFGSGATSRLDCVVNAASYRSASITPGMAVTIFGAGMGPSNGIIASVENGKIPTSVGGVTVTVNGVPAPLLFVRQDQINAVAPFAVSGTSPAQVRIEYQGRTLGPLTVNVKAADAGVFRIGSTEFGAILNQDNTLNTPENAAARDSIITFWATGMSSFQNIYEDGAIVGSDASFLVPQARVTFLGVEGEVLYAGASPFMVAGITQLNVRVPSNARVSSRVPISISVGDSFAGDVAYVAIK